MSSVVKYAALVLTHHLKLCLCKIIPQHCHIKSWMKFKLTKNDNNNLKLTTKDKLMTQDDM